MISTFSAFLSRAASATATATLRGAWGSAARLGRGVARGFSGLSAVLLLPFAAATFSPPAALRSNLTVAINHPLERTQIREPDGPVGVMFRVRKPKQASRAEAE